MLAQLSRSIQPITKLEITYWIRLPHDDPLVSSYGSNISKIVDANTKELLSIPPVKELDGIDAWALGQNGEILDVRIEPDTKFWPNGEHAIIGDLARFFNFSVHIRKDPIKPQEFDPTISVQPGYSDWIAWGLPLGSDNSLSFDTINEELYIFGTFSYNKSFWKSNGSITSIPDLLGAQLFLKPNNSTDYKLPKRFEKLRTHDLKPLTQSLEIKTVVLKFAEGREYWVDGNRFEKTAFKFGFPVFSITFPTTEGEMQKLRPVE